MIQTPHYVRIDGREVDMILHIHGERILHKSRLNATKCDCWDSITGHPTRRCSKCDNGWIYTDRYMVGYVTPIKPLGRSNTADYVTQAGKLQRYNHTIYTHGWQGEHIAVNDTLIFPLGEGLQKFEHDVVHSLVFRGTHGAKVYTSIFTMRKPYTETGIADITQPQPIA